MGILPHFVKSVAPRKLLAAVAALSLVAMCATGIAAFAGLLPASDHVARAMSASPLIDLQVDDSIDASPSR
jgi:hypothetical protein